MTDFNVIKATERIEPEPIEGYQVLFWGVITIYAIEYMGLGNYIPGANKVPLFLSAAIFIVSYLKHNGRGIFKFGQTKAILFLFLHTSISIAYAVVTTYAFRVFKGQAGYIILFISTYLVLGNARQIHRFMTAFVIFHCFVLLVNLETLSATMRAGSFKAGYFLGDGNDLSWSLTIFLPFALYLIFQKRSWVAKCILSASALLFVASIVRLGSRGAFLAIVSATCYLVIYSRKKGVAVMLALLVGITMIAIAPSFYLDRIKTIRTYQEDSSALGRIMAWKAAARMAVGHPFGVGAGNFNTAYGRFYRPSEVDERIWRPQRWISPHSIYFQVLGEYGIIGLATLLTLLFLNFRDNHRQMNQQKETGSPLPYEYGVSSLPKFLNTSLVAYSVGGVFLGGVSYPHIFVLTALILRTRELNAAKKQVDLVKAP